MDDPTKKTVFVTGRVAPSETETADEELTFGTHPNLNVGDKSYDFPKTKETYACLTDLPDKKVILGLAYHLIKSLEDKSPDRKELLAVKTYWSLENYQKQKQTLSQLRVNFPCLQILQQIR